MHCKLVLLNNLFVRLLNIFKYINMKKALKESFKWIDCII
jgi:hypothetical protein